MSSDFFDCTPRRALRKARRCYWCTGLIAIGEPAIRVAGVWDGNFATFVTHPDCNAAWQRDPCNEHEDGCEAWHTRGKTCVESEEEKAHDEK